MNYDYDISYVIFYLIAALVESCVFGAITLAINEKKGYEGGFWWGFFLGVIGIIVVACRESSYTVGYIPSNDSIYVAKKVAEAPIDKDAPVPDGGWRCICGRAHQPYESSCACGLSKRAALDGTAALTRDVLPAPPPPEPQDWTCTCGREHLSYETSCICGKTKHEVLTADIVLPEPDPTLIPEAPMEPDPIPEAQPEPVDDDQTIQALRKYKTLLDEGVITQEDFEAKKKQLLGL